MPRVPAVVNTERSFIVSSDSCFLNISDTNSREESKVFLHCEVIYEGLRAVAVTHHVQIVQRSRVM